VLGRARYTLGLGTIRSVKVTVRRRLQGRVIAEMTEQGVSKKGPRFSSRLLRVSS
jgi:hypothetical protein